MTKVIKIYGRRKHKKQIAKLYVTHYFSPLRLNPFYLLCAIQYPYKS